MDIIKSIEHEQLKNKIPDLKVGNTVKVHARIKEGNKERIQVFEGIIIKVQGSGVNKTFTVRKTSYGVGVEKTFLVHSPLVEKVELVRVGKARRAKLFYLRDRVGKSAKTKEVAGARIEDIEIEVKGAENVEAPTETEEVLETAEVTETADVAETSNEELAEKASEKKVEVTEKVAEEVMENAAAEEAVAEAVEEVVEETSKEATTEEAVAETVEEVVEKAAEVEVKPESETKAEDETKSESETKAEE